MKKEYERFLIYQREVDFLNFNVTLKEQINLTSIWNHQKSSHQNNPSNWEVEASLKANQINSSNLLSTCPYSICQSYPGLLSRLSVCTEDDFWFVTKKWQQLINSSPSSQGVSRGFVFILTLNEGCARDWSPPHKLLRPDPNIGKLFYDIYILFRRQRAICTKHVHLMLSTLTLF